MRRAVPHDFQGNWINREVNARCGNQRRALPHSKMSSVSYLHFLPVGLDVCFRSFTPLCPFQSTSLAKWKLVLTAFNFLHRKTVFFSTALCMPSSHCPEHCSTSCNCWQSYESTILCCHIPFGSNKGTNVREWTGCWQKTLYPLTWQPHLLVEVSEKWQQKQQKKIAVALSVFHLGVRVKEGRHQGDFPQLLRAGTWFLDKAPSRHFAEVLVLARQRPGLGGSGGQRWNRLPLPVPGGSTNSHQTQLTVYLWLKLNDWVNRGKNTLFPCQLNTFHDRVISEKQNATEQNSKTMLLFGLLMRNLFVLCKSGSSRLQPWTF